MSGAQVTAKARPNRFEFPAEDAALVVERALDEDVGGGDVTTCAVAPPDVVCRAELLLKEPGTVCGLPVARAVFEKLDPTVRFEPFVSDGDALRAPALLARLEGSAAPILTGERTALNLLGRLSGIATLTRRFVEAVAGTEATILDTRKTTPGLRALEKYAVRCGGGANHRFGLYDGVLIKDNHLRVAGSITAAVVRARQGGAAETTIEVEAETLADVREALAAGADWILLDNMTPDEQREAVALVEGRARLEASGGVTLGSIAAIARTGVDFVSVGALTHSARSLDVSLEVL